MMEYDDPVAPEFASWQSYHHFAERVRHSNRYVWDQAVQSFLDTVVATIQQRDQILGEGSIWFRAQQGVEWHEDKDDDGESMGEFISGYGADRMKPLPRRAKEGRANPSGIPVLYLGSTVETAVSEVRPWIGAQVSVARCRILKPLRTLDLSLAHGQSSFAGAVFEHMMGGRELTAAEKKTAVWTEIDNAFSRPVTLSDDQADYVPTQILTELFRAQGYDAIAYKSQFGKEKGYNIAVFDPDAVDVVTCAPYQVDAIQVECSQIGNDWYRAATPRDYADGTPENQTG